MSNLLNKAKDALSGGNKGHNEVHGDNPHSTNTGPHSSNIGNKADPRIDSDRDGRDNTLSREGALGQTQTAGTAGGYGSSTGYTAGHPGSAHDATTTGGNYGSSGTAGPHSSNLANKLDPRVDSDLDGSRKIGDNTGSYGTSGTTGGYGSATAGPHSSNLANKADPRVDSDLDGSRTTGNTGYGTTGTTGGYGSTTQGTAGGYGDSTTAGPHSSNLANKADPRVDSDLDGSRTTGNTSYGTTGTTGRAGGYGGSATAGPHSSNFANKADPRVDSDRDGSRAVGNTGSGTTGTPGHYSSGATGAGYGDNTLGNQSVGSGQSANAGPHNSNLLNKLDPRVDSDLSGGKTYGGSKTYE